MRLAENKYKNLKEAGKWGNWSKAESEIVTLNAKIEVLKHKGVKKPEGKAKKVEKKNKTKTGRKRRKQRKRKQTFICRNPEPTKQRELWMVKILLVPQSPEWGQWIQHKPGDCNNKQQNQSNKSTNTQATTTTSLQPNANLAAFDTIDSYTE